MAPDRIEQLLTAEDHTRPTHQELQKTELRRSQREQFTVQTCLTTTSVQFKRSSFQHAGRGHLATELKTNAGDELSNEEGLYDVVVSTELQAHNTIGL